MTLPYRIGRGLAVVVAIVAAHFVIAWLFDKMRLRAPDLGPVFATILVEPNAESKSATRKEDPAAPSDSRPRD